MSAFIRPGKEHQETLPPILPMPQKTQNRLIALFLRLTQFRRYSNARRKCVNRMREQIRQNQSDELSGRPSETGQRNAQRHFVPPKAPQKPSRMGVRIALKALNGREPALSLPYSGGEKLPGDCFGSRGRLGSLRLPKNLRIRYRHQAAWPSSLRFRNR